MRIKHTTTVLRLTVCGFLDVQAAHYPDVILCLDSVYHVICAFRVGDSKLGVVDIALLVQTKPE